MRIQLIICDYSTQLNIFLAEKNDMIYAHVFRMDEKKEKDRMECDTNQAERIQ